VAKVHINAKVPAAGAFSRPVRDIQTPSIDNADKTVSLIGQAVYPVDPNTDPVTYSMPSSQMITKYGVPEYVRTPTTFKVGTATAAGLTAVWTPTAGKRFRLMGGTFSIGSDVTTVGGATIQLADAGSGFMIMARVGLNSTGQGYSFQLPGNGYLSTAQDAVLNCNLSAALTAGQAAFSLYGTEE